MTTSANRVTGLPIANTLASTDRVLVIFNAASNSSVANGTPSLQSITLSNLMASIDAAVTVVSGPYANDLAAAGAGIKLGEMYYNSSGSVIVRLS